MMSELGIAPAELRDGVHMSVSARVTHEAYFLLPLPAGTCLDEATKPTSRLQHSRRVTATQHGMLHAPVPSELRGREVTTVNHHVFKQIQHQPETTLWTLGRPRNRSACHMMLRCPEASKGNWPPVKRPHRIKLRQVSRPASNQATSKLLANLLPQVLAA